MLATSVGIVRLLWYLTFVQCDIVSSDSMRVLAHLHSACPPVHGVSRENGQLNRLDTWCTSAQQDRQGMWTVQERLATQIFSHDYWLAAQLLLLLLLTLAQQVCIILGQSLHRYHPLSYITSTGKQTVQLDPVISIKRLSFNRLSVYQWC